MPGKFRFLEALRFPFENSINTMIIPGLIVYAEIIVFCLVILAVVIIVVIMGVSLGAMLHHTDVSALHALGQFCRLHLEWPSTMHLNPLAEVGSNPSDIPGNLSSIPHVPHTGSGSHFNAGLGQYWAGPVYGLLWCGYQWRLFSHFATKGYGSAPEWKDDFWGYLKDGARCAVFYLVLRAVLFLLIAIPVALFVILDWANLSAYVQNLWTLKDSGDWTPWIPLVIIIASFVLILAVIEFFIAPFFIAPMIQTSYSANNRTLAKLFDWPQNIATAKAHYGAVLLSFLLIALAWLVYSAGCIVLCFVTCCSGALLFPFIWEGGFRTTATYLMAQGFDLGSEHPTDKPPPAWL